jgi:hypothetical protein
MNTESKKYVAGLLVERIAEMDDWLAKTTAPLANPAVLAVHTERNIAVLAFYSLCDKPPQK